MILDGAADAFARKTASNITSPVINIFSSETPSRFRWSAAIRVGGNNSVETASVTTRLISSGIVRLKDLKPASTCISGKVNLDATSAPASVEFVSP